MNFVESYWSFLSRPLPSPKRVPGFAGLGNFWMNLTLWTIFFSVLHKIAPIIIKKMYPKWYDSLSQRKKNDLPAYVVTMVHHLTAVPVGWYIVICDYYGWVDFSNIVYPYDFLENLVIPFCLANVIADTFWYALPECFHMRFE